MAVCGNGVLEDDEPCDGEAFADGGCPVLGEASCTDDCVLDLSSCTDALTLCRSPAALLGPAQIAVNPLVDVIEVDDEFYVTDVDVAVNITHAWIGDLTAQIVAPDGVATSTLFREPCGMVDDIDASFDDDGTEPVCGFGPGLLGNFRPLTELRDLIGVGAKGAWSLVAWDAAPYADDGTLQTWCLELTLAVDDPVVCGDDVAHYGEACDGSDLGGMDCLSVEGGFFGGVLGCAADCTFDTTGCAPQACGNGSIDDGEACDGDALGGTTCDDLVGLTGAGLACAPDCTFDVTACEAVVCGDGVVAGDEACEPADLGGATCEDFPGYSSGVLGCTADCSGYDLGGCVSAFTEVCSSPSAPLSDLLGPTTDTVTFPDLGTVTDVDVVVDVSHTWVGDIQLELASPTGTSVLVFDGCADVDDVSAIFDDDGLPLSCGGTPGVSGIVAPNEPLAGFAGEAMAGDWALTVTDVAAGDDGTLDTWCLRISAPGG